MSSQTSSDIVVKALQESLQHKVFLPGTESYQESLRSYFTVQEAELKPICIVKPSSTEEVAIAVRTVLKADADVPLAVRSGGHNPSKGSANIEGGVTIDLRSLNSIDVKESQESVSVGAGAFWGHVYEKLEPLGISVVGAHVYNVGVAGFILGGGLSSLSPRYGFACDMVENFEIVLASGEVVNANARQNSDLWVALKGGSNNFGVVTRFDIKCFPQGKIWGGYLVGLMTTLDENLKALADMDPKWDEYASMKQSYTFSPKAGYSIATNIEYTKDSPEPNVVKPLLEIRPFYRNTLRTTTLSELATEIQKLQASATRQVFCTTSFELSLQHLHDTVDLFKKRVATVESIEEMRWTLTFQRLHGNIPAKGIENGGNVTGLPAETPSLVIAILTYSWSQSSDDEIMDTAAKGFLNEVEALSIKKGLYHPYKYLNYAAGFQKPLESHISSSRQVLEAVSMKYDPQRVFQKRVPGGFKTTS